MKYYITSLFNTAIEIPLITKLCSIIGAILLPYVPLIYILLVLITVDTITGIYRSTKEKFAIVKPKGFKEKIITFWNNIESRKLRYMIEKLCVYMLIILIFSTIEKYYVPFGFAGYTLTKIIAFLISLVEIKSILENLSKITDLPIIKSILTFFKKEVKNKIGLDMNETVSETNTTISQEGQKDINTTSKTTTSNKKNK